MSIIKASIPKFCESCETVFDYAAEGFFTEGYYQCQECANQAHIAQNEIINLRLLKRLQEAK